MKSTKDLLLLIAAVLLILLVPPAMPARQLSTHNNSRKRIRGETVEIAGSRLPDCSHACGSCSPCRLVMVRFFCASVEDSEACPLAYKCMCSHKSFPVP
ncbi:unnamed protein product [Citrullus colocynthis]|uniref:Epidermal patterning factor-like protein n=1 Tax=Citrullus colocynthis TaxID=252529 RepID=A0ABP0Y763_9ROSI